MSTFTRTIEDFTCGHCGTKVKGNGFTNHCPKCLWSKHVDFFPGDRQNTCGGLMEPVGLELRKKQYHLTHQCQKCGELTHCKTVDSDSIEALTKLSETLAKKTFF
ncbi:MAG: RNHCP domain-containing protein [Candidatus Doudnabacteria bacterium]|nr:RNHCP domain-containing protein [Candidatus Doudnabacteria bacterium]